MAEGPFQPVVLKDFSGGWVSSNDQEPDSLLPNQSPDLLNVDFSGKGSFEIRKGYTIFGNQDNTAGNIKRTWTFRRPINDDELYLRQNGTTIEYYHSGTATWETVPITGSITSGAKVGFANYTSSTDTVDYVYYSDGNTLTLQRWSGAHTQLNGALAGGEATITVDSTAEFATSGTIDIGGTAVTYTGKNATQFTGCSGTPAAADNAPVEQATNNFAASSGTKPIGNILEVFNGQLAISGDVSSPQIVNISDVDDFTDWGSGLADSQAAQGTGKFAGQKITGLKAKDGKLLVFTEDTVLALSYEFTGDLTGFLIKKEVIEDTNGYGAKVFTGITRADNTIFYVGSDNIIRQLITSDVSALFDTGSISENIKNTLKDYTMTNASAVFFENRIYIACQSDESSDINDTVLVFDPKYARSNGTGEAWTKYRLYVNDWFVRDDRLHFGSSADPNTYTLFVDDSGDDIITDNGSAISWYYSTPQLDFGRPELKFRISKVVNRGFISTNAEISYTGTYDYGTVAEQTLTLLGSNEDYVNIPFLAALGEVPVGEQDPVDSFNGQYPFTYPDMYGQIDFYNFQMTISGGTASERYRQTRLILYVEPQDDVLTN